MVRHRHPGKVRYHTRRGRLRLRRRPAHHHQRILIKKRGLFFGKPEKYNMDEDIAERTIDKQGKLASEMEPEEVEELTKKVKEDYEEGKDYSEGDHWGSRFPHNWTEEEKMSQNVFELEGRRVKVNGRSATVLEVRSSSKIGVEYEDGTTEWVDQIDIT